MRTLPYACKLNAMHWLRGESVLIVLILLAWCNAIREDHFVHYGTSAGDTVMQNKATATIPLINRFYVYGTPYTTARVSAYAQTFHSKNIAFIMTRNFLSIHEQCATVQNIL